MIERKRLEELIEQGATIYFLAPTNEIIEIHYNNKAFIDFYDNMFHFRNNYYNIDANFTSLFETKEETEWYKEFGYIERTERLVLPNFAEFNKCDKSVKFIDSKGTRYSMYVFVKNKKTNNCRIIIYADNGEQDWLVFEQPLTQENYTLACRKAKELFLGGKDE